MQIQHTPNDQGGSFHINKDSYTIAEMTYQLKGENIMVIDHTEVDEAFRNRNIGFELVKEGVEYARRENLKIVPVCEFAKSVFNKKEELRDVLQ